MSGLFLLGCLEVVVLIVDDVVVVGIVIVYGLNLFSDFELLVIEGLVFVGCEIILEVWVVCGNRFSGDDG